MGYVLTTLVSMVAMLTAHAVPEEKYICVRWRLARQKSSLLLRHTETEML